MINIYFIPVDWIALTIVSNAYKWSYAYKYAIQLSDRNPLLLGEILFETHFPKKNEGSKIEYYILSSITDKHFFHPTSLDTFYRDKTLEKAEIPGEIDV